MSAATADVTLVGTYVLGPVHGHRQVVDWAGQFRDQNELADHIDPEREAYLSLFSYPRTEFCRHFVSAGGSPRGYAGPAACPLLVLDVDRKEDLAVALADTRQLVRHLLVRYGSSIDDLVSIYFSGSKGFHVGIPMPAFSPTCGVPTTCKKLALAIAVSAGVTIDAACYDHQRLLRLPNSRHPKTGLYKRPLTLEELFRLRIGRIQDLARDPAGYAIPTCAGRNQHLEGDWVAASVAHPFRCAAQSAAPRPVVPKFVRDFIGFADIQNPGRAVTLFRCAAALAEAETPDAVIYGLLEEPALKSGLEPAEVQRQINSGINHARGQQTGGDS